MAPAKFGSQPGLLCAKPWAAKAFAGVVLRIRRGVEVEASLREVRADVAEGAFVSDVVFRADGACEVRELKGSDWHTVGVLCDCREVRWRWEKLGGRRKVWAQSETGDTVVLSKTFETSSPQLKLFSWTLSCLKVFLLPLRLPSPQASQALRVQELTAEVQHQRAQQPELQQQCNALKQQLTEITQQRVRWLLVRRSGRSANINLQPDEGAGDSPASSNWAVLGGAEEEVQSVSDASDASSQSAKCFLPNTALPSADGHLLRVEHLKPGDRVRQSDGAEASVVDVKKHPSKKKPYEVVELSTHQGKFACSKSHRVAVPGATGLCDQRADSLKLGDWVIVGSEERKLTKVVNRKEHTDLYEVVFEAAGPWKCSP